MWFEGATAEGANVVWVVAPIDAKVVEDIFPKEPLNVNMWVNPELRVNWSCFLGHPPHLFSKFRIIRLRSALIEELQKLFCVPLSQIIEIFIK